MANKQMNYSVENLNIHAISGNIETQYAYSDSRSLNKKSIFKNGFLLAGCLSVGAMPLQAKQFAPSPYSSKFELILDAANQAVFETTAPDIYSKSLNISSKSYQLTELFERALEASNDRFHLSPNNLDVIEAATIAFNGSKPMMGIEYDHLDRLVHKNAHTRPIIPGML